MDKQKAQKKAIQSSSSKEGILDHTPKKDFKKTRTNMEKVLDKMRAGVLKLRDK